MNRLEHVPENQFDRLNSFIFYHVDNEVKKCPFFTFNSPLSLDNMNSDE